MDAIGRLIASINQTVDGARQAQIRFVECVSVDWDNKTMDAKGSNDGVEYLDVTLGFGYTDIKPVVGSVCLIGIIDGQEVVTFLINAENVELVETKAKNIIFNGGDNLGLAKVKELTERFNKIETAFNSLLNEYKIHNHTHPQGVTTGFVVPPITSNISQTKIKDIENPNITH